jgi:membrane protein implicated in regulation of membrane protease activity
MMLPWIAVPLGMAGVWMVLRGDTTGWWLVVLAAALLIVDLLISLVWAKRTRARSDQPSLNQRGAQYVGRQVCVVEDIIGGEGKVRIADTVWRVRGPDCTAGTWVRVTGADGPHLVVSAADERDTHSA